MASKSSGKAPGMPIAIKRLDELDQVIVSQKCTMFSNKYVVTTSQGDTLLQVKEDGNAFAAMLGGASRGFHMDMYDVDDKVVINLRRPHTFTLSKLEVFVCGELASVVRQEVTLMKPLLSIRDARDQPVLRVKGPISVSYECDFELQTLDKQRIGSISKQWGGVLKEALTRADQFTITFPRDLDVRYKAAALGTCMLIDFLYYEKSG